MLRKYFLAWFGMMLLAILNGGMRDWLYQPLLGEHTAHQVSTIVLLVLLFAYLWTLAAFWPIESASRAWQIGAMWLAMTLAFEVMLGRLMLSYSWERITQEYDLSAGNLWILIPVWTLIGPYALFRLRAGRDRA